MYLNMRLELVHLADAAEEGESAAAKKLAEG
jgi:hypothetical protein